MIINPYRFGSPPVAIGNIFDELQLNKVPTDGFNASSWDIFGAPNPTFSAGNINFNSALAGPPYFTNTMAYKNWYSCLENFVWQAEVQIVDITEAGISLGLWYWGNSEYLYQMWLFGSGRMDLWASANTFITNVPAGSVTIANGDWIRIKMQKVTDVLTISAENLTQGLPPVTVSLTYTFTYPFSFITPQTFRPAIGNMGGSHNIRNFSYSTTDKKNIDALFITDSKGLYFPNNYVDSCIGQLRTNNPSKVIEINSAANETLATDILNEGEDILYKAKKVFLFRGCNDRRFGASQATMEADMTTIKNYHEANGSIVYFIESLPEGPGGASINSTIVNAAGANVFAPSKIIPAYAPFWSGVGTGANPAFFEADLIHPNLAGHNLMTTIFQPYL